MSYYIAYGIYYFAIYFALFMLGGIIASFIVVLIYRTKTKQKNIGLSGRSYCDKCKTPLKLYNIIPIFSYLFQKGKCSYCGVKIPPKYFYYELITGMVFVIIGLIIHYFFFT